jgi:hypothetical protein
VLRRPVALAAACALTLALAACARAGGGDYLFDGGLLGEGRFASTVVQAAHHELRLRALRLARARSQRELAIAHVADNSKP